MTGPAELAIESSGTSGHVTRVYLSRRELEYNARQGGLMLGLSTASGGETGSLSTLGLDWGLGSLPVERLMRYTPMFSMVVGRVDPREAYERLGEKYRFQRHRRRSLLAGPADRDRARARTARGQMKVPDRRRRGDHAARTRAELERLRGALVCMTYASTEAATILGFECTQRAGYHVNEFSLLSSLVPPRRFQPDRLRAVRRIDTAHWTTRSVSEVVPAVRQAAVPPVATASSSEGHRADEGRRGSSA